MKSIAESVSAIFAIPADMMERTRNVERKQRPEEAQALPAERRSLIRFLPVVAIVAALLLLYGLGTEEYFSLEALHHYRWRLRALVEAHAILASAVYLLLYVAAVAVSFPVAGFLTIAAGFLFGVALGATLATLGATAGATLAFLFARTSVGDLLARRAGPRTHRLQEGFAEDGFSYLLFLRLVPLFPFWLVNLAAAIFGVRLLPYVAATALGILPSTALFAWFGSGLSATIKTRQPFSLQLFIALLLLGVMALMPVAVRRWRRSRAKGPEATGKP